MQKIEHCDERVRRERRFPSSLNTGLGQKLKFHQFCSSLAQYESGEILNIEVNQAYYACLVQDGPPTNHLTN